MSTTIYSPRVSTRVAADRIRTALDGLPDRTINGVGARESLRAMTGLSDAQFAKGLAYNLTVWEDIFIVENHGRIGSTYRITKDPDLAWGPITADGRYIHHRAGSLGKKIDVVERALVDADAPLATRGVVYAARRSVDEARSALAALVRQTGTMAGFSEEVIESWLAEVSV